MGGMFGFISFDDASVAVSSLRHMSEASGGASAAHESNERLAAFACMNCGGNDGPCGYFALPQEGLYCIADARLDNRATLSESLRVDAERPPVSDAELVCRAYRQWGEGLPKHLVGDFAFVVWDEKKRTLFCARDHLGIKPFYYIHIRGKYFAFASEIRVLFGLPGNTKRLNGDALECSLLYDAIAFEQTYYEAVSRLKYASYLVCSGERVGIEAYWNPADAVSEFTGTFEEAADRLKDLLFNAVEARCPQNDTSTGFELSGGMDSSSVVAVARALHPKAVLATYSLRFGNLSCDEGNYIDAVNTVVRSAPHMVYSQKGPHEHPDDLLHIYEKFPDWPIDLFFLPHMDLARQAMNDGVRVLLTGQGGDEVLQGSRYLPADCLKRGKWLLFLKEMFSGKNYRRDWYRYGLRPYLSERYHAYFKREESATRPGSVWGKACSKPLSGMPVAELFSVRQSLRMLFGAEHALWSEANPYRLAEQRGIEVRHPLLDIHLIEFALSLPPEYLYGGGMYKRLFRASMKNLLPETVRTRGDKVDFNEVVATELKQAVDRDRHFANIDAFEIRRHVVPELWERLPELHAKRGFEHPQTFLHWKLVNLEAWYIANFG